MINLNKLVLILTAAVILGFASNAEAQTRGSLSARAKGNVKAMTFKKRCQSYRVNDCGKPLRKWKQQVTYRATNDTFVYRSQNKATTRHDEVSSPAIIFHVQGGKLRSGHVYQYRGN
ncbi:MAG: hypothetical protein P1U89_05625 [Verrucomicrobiales bacterium]|nr:hypothetical protein [Verrucomicrobiales bacterium]